MYVKIFAGILRSSIAKNTPLRRFFQDLLLLADQDGNVIATKDAIANELRVPLDEVDWGINELMKPDPESFSQEADGRRIMPINGCGYGWKIINYGFYRGMRTPQDQRAANAKRQQAWRDRQKSNGSNGSNALRNGNNAIAEAEAEAEANADAEEEQELHVKTPVLTGSKPVRKVPYEQILGLYEELLPTLPRIFKLSDARKQQIAARWRDDMTDLDDWREYFQRVASSSFLMGRSKPMPGRKIFRADLTWLTKSENFLKVMEGKYDG